MGNNFMFPGHPLDKHLYLPTRFLFAEKARRNHPGVVKHQQVTGLKQIRKFTENAMIKLAGKTIQTKQP